MWFVCQLSLIAKIFKQVTIPSIAKRLIHQNQETLLPYRQIKLSIRPKQLKDNFPLFRLRSHYYHAEWKNSCMNIAEDLMNLLAFFIRHDHHDTITKPLSLSLNYLRLTGWLFSLADLGLSAMTSENVKAFKSRDNSISPFYKGLYRNNFLPAECDVPGQYPTSRSEGTCWPKYPLQDEDHSGNSPICTPDSICISLGIVRSSSLLNPKMWFHEKIVQFRKRA